MTSLLFVSLALSVGLCSGRRGDHLQYAFVWKHKYLSKLYLFFRAGLFRMALPNVGEECSRNSPLPTIQESEESNDDLNELENVLKLSRKKREHRTPSKKKPDSDVVPSSSNVRQRTPRHCASRAREKITTLLNPKDTSGGEYYAASDYGSDGSEEAYHPTIDEDIMPKGECKNEINILRSTTNIDSERLNFEFCRIQTEPLLMTTMTKTWWAKVLKSLALKRRAGGGARWWGPRRWRLPRRWASRDSTGPRTKRRWKLKRKSVRFRRRRPFDGNWETVSQRSKKIDLITNNKTPVAYFQKLSR